MARWVVQFLHLRRLGACFVYDALGSFDINSLRCQDSNWRSRESAILALGAVSHGCHAGLQPYLEGMIHMLLPALQDARPMVRIITCWTLGRYSHWLFHGKRAAAAGRRGLRGLVRPARRPGASWGLPRSVHGGGASINFIPSWLAV